MKLSTIAITLAACLLLIGCGKGNINSNTSNTTTTTKTTTAASPSPQASATASATPGKTTSSEDKVSTPEAAAQGLFNAFGRHDRDAAAKFASEAAISKLFKESTGTEGMQFQGCDEGESGTDCAYYYEGGGLIMHIKGSESTGYKVDSIEFIAD